MASIWPESKHTRASEYTIQIVFNSRLETLAAARASLKLGFGYSGKARSLMDLDIWIRGSLGMSLS